MTISRFALQSQQVGFLTPVDVVGYMHNEKILKEDCRRHFFKNEGRMRAYDRRKGVKAVLFPAFPCFFLACSKKNGPKKLSGAWHVGY